MGTQLGNVTQIYGKKHNTTVTNLNGDTIMKSSYLKENTFIVSAPQTINKEDIGTYSLFMTDSEGRPVRLSYTIQPGNGLVVGRGGEPAESGDNLDIISMAIDNLSIKADDPEYPGAIYVKKENIIDNDTLMVVTPEDQPSCIKVITEHLDHAGTTSTGFGIAQGDGNTITTYDGYLTVKTRNLDYADDETDTHGIIDANTNPYRTVRSDNGILSVWTQNLDRATVDSLGVVKPDGTYTFTDDEGVITVGNFVYTYSYLGNRPVIIDNVESVETYRWSEHGIVVPDLITLGTYEPGEMHVITDGLDKASDSQYGVVKTDGISTGITSDGLLEVKQYAKLQAIMDVFDSRYTYILNKLNELEGRIVVLETTSSTENIELDIDNSMISILTEPTWDAENGVVVSPMENISVELRVSTNCKFKVSVEYEDNVNPAIVLTQLKLGSDIVVTAAGLQDYEFDSTDDTINQLKLTFECSNYTSKTTNESELSTVATIKITSMNDASVYKKAVHTFVRHNTEKYVQRDRPSRPIIPDVDPRYKSWIPAYVHSMSTDETQYSNSIPRFATSNQLVKFNILGPYHTSLQNHGLFIEKYSEDKNIFPRLTASQYAGYLGVNVEYIDPETTETIESNDWLRYKLETTYNICRGRDDNDTEYAYNVLRLYSIQGLSYQQPNRSAKVTFTYYTTAEHNETSNYTVIYNENLEEQRPTLKLVATISDGKRFGETTSFIHIDATKSNGALMNPDTNNNWSVTAYMKYVKSDGTFVVPVEEAAYDVEYTFNGSVDVDTISFDLPQKPKVTSDTVGCKIVDAKSDSFQYAKEDAEGPIISFVTRNMWIKQPTNKNYTFGNATITKMKVNRWDDLELRIQFDIVPGTTTNIPTGATIKELENTADGNRLFKFFKGSSSFDWREYYDTCTFTASEWNSFGTTVTFRFTNKQSALSNTSVSFNALYQGSITNTINGMTAMNSISNDSLYGLGTNNKSTLPNYTYLNTDTNKYEIISRPLTHKYSPEVISMNRVNEGMPIPRLDYFGHIKFWFALSASFNGVAATTNFEVSTTGSSDKIGNGGHTFKYGNTVETVLSIINAYYRTAVSTSNISNIGNVLTNTAEFAKTVEELKTTINELKTIESAAILTGVNTNVNLDSKTSLTKTVSQLNTKSTNKTLK